jgi:hypothetical protein
VNNCILSEQIDRLSESEIQVRVANYLKLVQPGVMFTSSPAGLKLTVGQVQKMMQMGYRKGTADLFIMELRGKYAGLWLELKTLTGGISAGQPEFGIDCEKRGYSYAVAHGYEDAIKILKWYLGGAK